ncbi:MAG: uracil-DNA glycosylase [Ectothiorhodospiraceae bacterium]|nr:uracil-DNA glycosylase [Ectothiorhodospiraceae bacterium]
MLSPDRNCSLCPRLVGLRHDLERQHPGWHNAPVPTVGPGRAPLLVVGLAPGLTGANRTGFPFHGDGSGDWLMAALAEIGRAELRDSRPPGLRGVRITNAVRCLPPGNLPNGSERARCSQYLRADVQHLLGGPRRRRRVAVLALGRVAHEEVLRALELPRAEHPFGHGFEHEIGRRALLLDSFHCSRYNVNTGRLSWPSFLYLFQQLHHWLDAPLRPA